MFNLVIIIMQMGINFIHTAVCRKQILKFYIHSLQPIVEAGK